MSVGRGRKFLNPKPVVLITGASSGIGKATSLYLAEKGCSVIGTGRSMARLEDLKREASRRDLPVTPIEMDINSDQDVDRVFPGLLDEFETIDVLVNNAGYLLWGPGESLTVAEVKTLFETNFFAAIRLTNLVLPGMMRRGSGTIINMSSVLGRLGTPFNGAYAASKFALEGLSESLRIELWPFGVRVVVVEPGVFHTSLQQNRVVAVGVRSGEGVYAPFIERYQSRHDRFEGLAGDPVKVAKVVYKIIRSRRPRFRYPVGPDARLGILGAKLIPERVFQAILSRAIMK